MSRMGTSVTSMTIFARSTPAASVSVSSFIASSPTILQTPSQRYSTVASRSSAMLSRNASSSYLATTHDPQSTSIVAAPAGTESENNDNTATNSPMRFFALFVLVAVIGAIILWLFYRRKRRRQQVARRRISTGALRSDLDNMSGWRSRNPWHHRASETARSVENLPVYLGDPPRYPELAMSEIRGTGLSATTSAHLHLANGPLRSQASMSTENSLAGSVSAVSESSDEFDELESMSPYRTDVASLHSIEAITHATMFRYDASRSSGSSA